MSWNRNAQRANEKALAATLLENDKVRYRPTYVISNYDRARAVSRTRICVGPIVKTAGA